MKTYTLENYKDLMKDVSLFTDCDLKQAAEVEITNLTYDSNEVTPGTLFICKGVTFKEEYLKTALSKGAVGYISAIKYDVNAPFILVSDIRKAMPYLAEKFFNAPAEKLKLTGITGTKGKSTTAYYIKAIIDDYLKDVEKPL